VRTAAAAVVIVPGIVAALTVVGATQTPPADPSADRLTVPFSNPSQPGMLRIGLVSGGVTVRGYDGKDVLIDARLREDAKQSERRSRDGLRRIANTSTGLTVEEDDNVMRVSASHNRDVDLIVQVPSRTNLKLSCVNDGDIVVENVSGDVEASNTNGAVTLTGVSGAVVAHAFNEDLKVTFARVPPGKPMSFSSFNGDIDVSLPSAVKATVKLQTANGEILTDFDLTMQPNVVQRTEEPDQAKGGKYRVKIDKVMMGTINGGGPEYFFKNYNGDIRIRKTR